MFQHLFGINTMDIVDSFFCSKIQFSINGFAYSLLLIPGVKSSNDTEKDLGPYPGGATPSMVNYANFNQVCVDTAMTPFMQYLPFILLLQAVFVIMIEKMLMKFPRVAGKIERFYGSIVEEAISRRRRRN